MACVAGTGPSAGRGTPTGEETGEQETDPDLIKERDFELDVTASSLKLTWHLFWFVNSDIKMSDEQGDANILKVFSQKRKVQFD